VKKFLIVLTVITLASLLMGAGCFISNLPPVITSDPVTTAKVGVVYNYDVEATDPDIEDVLTYYLTAYPNGMNINSATGLIKWIPAIEGDYKVTVKVSDGDLDIIQSFTIVVSDEPVIPNEPPEITTSAITSGKVGVEYIYNVKATDPDEDILTYSLTEKPLGMSIVSTTGIISWMPTDAGVFGVGVMVSDGELSDTQSISVTVAKADEGEPPVGETEVPVITSVLEADDDNYVNDVENTGEITVRGFSIDGSLVKLYLDDKLVGTTTTSRTKSGYATFEFFDLVIDLGKDGEKNLYATAQIPGYIVSDPSDPYTFILDTTAPEIVSITGEVEGFEIDDGGTLTITCSEAIKEGSLVLDFVGSDPGDPIENATNLWDITIILPSDFFSEDFGKHLNILADSFQYDLVVPEVIELSGEFGEDYTGTLGDVDNLIRVSYEISEAAEPPEGYEYIPITDLAGNELLDSVHYCVLEVAE